MQDEDASRGNHNTPSEPDFQPRPEYEADSESRAEIAYPADAVAESDAVTDEESPGQQDGPLTTKVCARCSVQSQTTGGFCPNCGASFDRSRQGRNRTFKVVAIALAAVIILGGGATAIALSVANNNEIAAQRVAAKQAKAEADAEAEQLATAASAQEASDTTERDLRKTSVAGIEASITTDAQTKVTDGLLEGPITNSSCTPLGGGSTDDLTAITTTFTCIAINKENADGTSSGYRFSATMNWDDGSYTWHLGG